MKKHHLLAASSLLVAAGALSYLALPSRSQAADAPAAIKPAAPRVTVAPVEQRLVTEYEELTGRVEARETVELRARVSGHLESVGFQAGQLVRKGDLLFSIDPRWHQAQFDLASARAQLAESEAARAEELLRASAISTEEAERRRAELLAARATLDSARLDLEHTRVLAPITGRVSRALVTEGNLISGSAGGGTLLTTIVSEGDSYVYADIDEATLLRFNRLVRENRLPSVNGHVPAELQLSDEEGYPRTGYIESADNRLNPATGSLAIRLVFPNTDKALVPGLFARVRIPVSAPEPSLLVSERAIGTDQSQKFVLAVDASHTVAYRPVKLGSSLQGKRVVREGLQPGDRIIVNGLQRVRPGMTVEAETQLADSAPEAPNGPASKLATLH